ncbi:hypothetical protein ES702_01922 [subsurface metagenome]
MLFDKLAKIFRAAIDDDEKVELAQEEIETQGNVLISKMLKKRPRLDPAKMQWFGEEQVIDLGKAHSNAKIWNRGGRGLFITKMDGTPTTTLIRFNNIAGPTYEVYVGHIKNAFQGIYLTNAAEAGKTLKFVVGYRNFAEFQMLESEGLLKATTSTIYKIIMTTEHTEYSQVLPEGCKQLQAVVADGTAARLAWVTGQVATDLVTWDLLANAVYRRSRLDLRGKTLYFACSEAGKVMKIEAWV